MSRVIKHKSRLLIKPITADIQQINEQLIKLAQQYIRHTHFQLEIIIPSSIDISEIELLKTHWSRRGWWAEINLDLGSQKFRLRSTIDTIPH